MMKEKTVRRILIALVLIPSLALAIDFTGKIGLEDLRLGSGTFTRRTSTGGTVTLTEINATNLALEGGSLPWTYIISTPTTLAGYGITDAASAFTSLPWDNVTSRPTINSVTLTGSVLDNILNYPAGLARLASPTFTGTVVVPTPFTLGAVSVTATGTELNYSVGGSSAFQGQIDDKQGASTTLTDLSDANLTAPLTFTDDVYLKFGTDNDFRAYYKAADATLVIALDNGSAMCTFSKTGGLACTGEITAQQYATTGTDNNFFVQVANSGPPPIPATDNAGMIWFSTADNTLKVTNSAGAVGTVSVTW